MKPLAGFSDDELLGELARRRRQREAAGRTPPAWCDACVHFQTWAGEGDAPEGFSPCSRGHVMWFRVPVDPGDEYGFYLPGCLDRRVDVEEEGAPR